MSGIQEIQAEIVEDFAMFDDWMQKYEYLIDLGKELDPIEFFGHINDKLKIALRF